MKTYRMAVTLRSGSSTVEVHAASALAALRDTKARYPGALKIEHSTADHRAG